MTKPSTCDDAVTEPGKIMRDIEEVADFLKKNKLKLATAESCTCGQMASLLGDVAGCGQILDRGFVAYSPDAKHELLGVKFDTIEAHGLTSEEVATEMALGALRSSVAMLAVSNTGVADDRQEDHGGTQCYAWALQDGDRQAVISETIRFKGDRCEIRSHAARYGLSRVPERYQALRSKLGGMQEDSDARLVA